MKLKFINLLLASVLLVGSAQVFTSCKDNEADLFVNLKQETISLADRLKSDEALIAQLQNGLKQEIANRTEQDKFLKGEIDRLNNRINILNEDLAALREQMKQGDNKLNDRINALETEIHELEKTVASHTKELAEIRADIDKLNKCCEEMQAFKEFVEGKLSEHDGAIQDIIDHMDKMDVDINDLFTRLEIVEIGLDKVKSDLGSLTTKVGEIENNVTELQAFMNEWKSVLPTIQENAANALAQAETNKLKIEELLALIEQYKNDSDLADATLLGLIEALKDDFNSKLDNYATLEELAEATAKLQAQAEENYKASIAYTLNMCAGLRVYVDSTFATVADLNQAIADLEDAIAGKADKADVEALQQAVDAIEENVEDLQTLYNTLKENVDANTAAIAELSDAIDTLTDRIEQVAGRVNGVIIQQVHNPILGSFNLPIGINSQMLLGWWGKISNPTEFPTADESLGYRTDDNYTGLTDADLANIGTTPEEVAPGYIMLKNEDGKGVLGTVYMTVNPANTNLQSDKYTVNVVNSLGKASPIELSPVPSETELTVGYTRAGTDNGFWESEALININKADIEGIEFQFKNMDAFTATVKNIINNGRKSVNAGTIAKLSAALFEQVNGVLPALAVSVSWDEAGVTNQATSAYGLAAATLHARGLQILNQFDGKIAPIPAIPDLSGLQDRFNAWYDQMQGKLKISLGDQNFTIDAGTFNITIGTPTLDFSAIPGSIAVSATAEVNIPVTITVDGTEYTGNASGSVPVDGTASTTDLVDALQNAVQSALDQALGNASASINAQVTAKLQDIADNIAGQVNDLFASMETNINSQIGTILDDIQAEINGKIDALSGGRLSGLLDKAQWLLDRLNGVLTEPSYYLQPVLLYDGGQRVGMLSTNKAMPTVFNVNGSAAVKLIPTTYTLETVVPLYQKFVAVTNVWKNGVADAAARTAANNVLGMNEVLPGNRHIVALTLEKGCTYEIAYQGMDYLGQVSGRKYYVTVK